METLFKSRLITSVYFDTVDLNMFHDSEEGVLPRKKVRIRWYNDGEIFTLESKTSSIEGRFKVTSKMQYYTFENEFLSRSRMDTQYGNIQPALKVSYKRSYFMFHGMRVTFDKDISYQNLRFVNMRKFYDPERVIEIKIPADCPDDFVEKRIPYQTTRFSKYSRGLLLSLGHLCEV
jgi:SPX domain protein involved in polyphosphate accumulation